MNTRRILAVAFTVCLLLCAAIAVCAAVFTRQFDAVEHNAAELRLREGLQALDAHAARLARQAGERAQSPATSNRAALLASGMDALAVLDSSGRELQAAQVDRTRRGTEELAPALRAQLLQLWSDRQHQPAGPRQGWFSTARGLLAVCVLDANGGAWLFAGSYFDAALADGLDLIVLNDPAQPTALAPPVAAWLYQSAPADVLVLDDADTHASVAHAVLRDVAGRPIAVLRSTSSGAVALAGRRTTWLSMGSLALLLGASSFVLILLLLRQQPAPGPRLAGQDLSGALRESVALVDLQDGSFINVNEALLQALDYERSDLAVLSMRGVYLDLPDDLGAAALPDSPPLECRLRARDGRLIDTEITFAAVPDASRQLLCIVGRDISQRKQAEQSLAESVSLFEHLCTHDALTELPNRTYLQTHLPTLLQDAADDSRLVAVMYLDLDGFDAHCVALGQGSGDALLKLVAERLRNELPADHLVARTEGDEFVIVAPALSSSAAVTALAEQLLDRVRRPLTLTEASITLTASMGVAIYPQHGLDGDTLLKHADIALYQAKQHGRNQYRCFVDDMNLQQSEHVILEQALRRAIDTDQIQLEYQPVVDLQTGLVISFEALARWRHPLLGTVPPERFIPVAERSRLMLPLGEQIVRMAILQLHDWQAAGLSLVPVAINVAPLQLELTDLAAYVADLLRRYAVDPKWLSFEVSEAVWAQPTGKHIATLQQLRAAGSRVYLDDCTAGLIDAAQLQALPVDALKLDPRLIREQSEAVTNTMALARRLHLMTVAEGVETIEQVEQLRQLGCQCGQGYYFSKPIAPLQCRSLLQHMGEARRLTETVKVRAFRINRAVATAG